MLSWKKDYCFIFINFVSKNVKVYLFVHFIKIQMYIIFMYAVVIGCSYYTDIVAVIISKC